MTVPFAYAEHTAAFDPGIVSAIWSVSTCHASKAESTAPYRVLPDGCLDLVLRVRPDVPDSVARPDLFIGGPACIASVVSVAPGTLHYGVRFQPGFGGAALGLAASDLTDVTLADADARALLGSLAARLHGAGDLRALRGRLFDVLATISERAKEHSPPPHVRLALGLLQSSRGRISVGKMARKVGVSDRTLHRSVTEAAGLSPKTLASVLRFQHALSLVREGKPLADVAAETGYSDQAHMTRAFQSFGGFTPGTSLS